MPGENQTTLQAVEADTANTPQGTATETESTKDSPFDFGDPTENIPAGDTDNDESNSGGDDNSDAGISAGDDSEGHAHAFDADLLKRAEQLGMSDAEAKAFGDPKVLDLALTKMERTLNHWYATAIQGRHEQAKNGGAGDEKTAHDEFKIELDEEAIDPSLVGAIKSMKAHYDGVVTKMQEQLQQVTGAASYASQVAQQRELQTFFGEFDETVKGLDDQFGGIFGKDAKGLSADSPEAKARGVILDTYQAMRGMYIQNNRPVPDSATLIKQAAYAVFGEKAIENAHRAVINKAKSRSSQALQRPTHRDSGAANMSRMERAVSAVATKMREYGAPDDEA